MGIDMAYYEDSIIRAVEQRNISFGGNLMLYFDEEQNSGVKKKAESTVPSVEIRNRELIGCTTVKLKESLTDKEMADLKEMFLVENTHKAIIDKETFEKVQERKRAHQGNRINHPKMLYS